jgi:hypothetical protein
LQKHVLNGLKPGLVCFFDSCCGPTTLKGRICVLLYACLDI